jgi:hypothetical protein
MTWKIKIKGEKYIAEVLSDDLSNAIFKADQCRSQGLCCCLFDLSLLIGGGRFILRA